MYYPSTDDILASLGLARLRASPAVPPWVAPAAIMFGTGLVAGAAGALLLTPKTGPELRHDLFAAVKGATDTVKNRLPGIGTPSPIDDRPVAVGATAEAK